MPITELNEKVRTVYLVSGCVIEKGGKFLLVQEAKPIVRGKWNLPAGKAEIDLTLEQNAVKEAKEETGYDVRIKQRVGIYYQEGDRTVRFVFEAKIVGGQIDFDKDEIMDAKWFDYFELKKMDKNDELRDFWVLQAIEDYRNIIKK